MLFLSFWSEGTARENFLYCSSEVMFGLVAGENLSQRRLYNGESSLFRVNNYIFDIWLELFKLYRKENQLYQPSDNLQQHNMVDNLQQHNMVDNLQQHNMGDNGEKNTIEKQEIK